LDIIKICVLFFFLTQINLVSKLPILGF